MSKKERVRQRRLKMLLIVFAILSTIASYTPAVIHEFSLYLSQARAETRQEIVGIPRAHRDTMINIPNEFRQKERFDWPPKTTQGYWRTERWVHIRRDMYAKYFGERNHSGSPIEWIGDKVVDAQRDFEAAWLEYDSLTRQHFTDAELQAGKKEFEAQGKLFWVKSIPVDHSGLWWLIPLGHLGAMIGFLPLLLYSVLTSTFEGKRYNLVVEILTLRFPVAWLTCYASPFYYPYGDPRKAVLKAMWATTLFLVCALCGPMIIVAKAVTIKRQRKANTETLFSLPNVKIVDNRNHLILNDVSRPQLPVVAPTPVVIQNQSPFVGVEVEDQISGGSDANGWQFFVESTEQDQLPRDTESLPKSCPMPTVVELSELPSFELVPAVLRKSKVTIYGEGLPKYIGLNGAAFSRGPVAQVGITAEWDNGVFVDLWTSSGLASAPSVDNFAFEGNVTVGKKLRPKRLNNTQITAAATYVATTPYSQAWGKGDVIQLRASVDRSTKIVGLPVNLYGMVRHFFPVSGSKPDAGTFYQFGGNANLDKGPFGFSVNPEILLDSGAFDFDRAVIGRLNLVTSWKVRQHLRFMLPIIRASAPLTHVNDGRKFQLVIGAGATFILP